MDIGKDLANAYEEGMRDARAKIDNEVFELQTEVKQLERICNSYALQYGTVKDQQAVIDKAKAEVAREIFEDLYEMLVPEESTDGLIYYFDKEELAELKKKYQEGEPNG